MKKLRQLFVIYSEYADSIRQFSTMLWSELDVNKMMTGTEEILHKLRKLKELKQLPTYSLVENEIQGFCDSLPLMKELKSDALRWVISCRTMYFRLLFRA